MQASDVVDQTVAFYIALYVLAMETLLFFAVVMHSQNAEPLLHPGVARHFGLLFLFQAASALLMVVAEQTYPSAVSEAFALLTIVTISCAVCMSIPAALVVAFPEGSESPTASKRATAAAAFTLVLVLCVLALPGESRAVLDLPYVPPVYAWCAASRDATAPWYSQHRWESSPFSASSGRYSNLYAAQKMGNLSRSKNAPSLQPSTTTCS